MCFPDVYEIVRFDKFAGNGERIVLADIKSWVGKTPALDQGECSLYPALIDVSPDITRFLTSSLSEFKTLAPMR